MTDAFDDLDVDIEIVAADLDADDDLPLVAASEQSLILMARALIQPAAYDVHAYLAGARELPPQIGPTCAQLIGDALSHAWPALWRRDRARPGVTIKPGAANAVVRGRGWERHGAPPTLKFTTATLALLRWLVGEPLASGGTLPELAARPLQLGDQVAIYLALDLLPTGAAPQLAIARQPMVQACPLAWLGFAHVMAARGSDRRPEPPPFDDLVSAGGGSIIIEALAADLAARWRAAERAKALVTDPATLYATGSAQVVALDSFMSACDRAHRRDLAGFVIDAAAPVVAQSRAPAPRTLDPRATLAARTAARTASGALLRGVARWAEWDAAHRGVRFIDDGYDVAQYLLARFEAIGRPGADRAASWLADLAALAPTPPSPGSATMEVP